MKKDKGNAISPNVIWHKATVNLLRRQKLNGHKGVILWFTGLPGSGKSTLARAVEEELHKRKCHTYVLDGDNVRHGLCGDLAFSEKDRQENLRRIGELTKLFLDAAIITLTAFVSPAEKDRNFVRNLVAQGDFLEIYCSASVAVCEKRDIKGHYKMAREGKIKNYTGISAPYEEPVNPELNLDTATISLEDSVAKVIQLLDKRGII
jgi:adenylylsulfate kinase